MLTPGAILKKRRQTLRKTLSQVSLETKIQEKYLKLLESEEYNQFDSNVFISGFIKIYSEYLGLDVEKMLALYRRSDKALKEPVGGSNKRKIFNIDFRKIVTPMSTVIAIMVVSLSLFLLNTINKYNEIQKKPTITVEFPENNHQTEESKIVIKGRTEDGNQISINDNEVDTDNGNFQHELELESDENIVEIKSTNPESNLVTIKTLRVEKIAPAVDEEVEKPESEIKTFNTYLVIKTEAAWVQLTVDGEQKLAQVVQPSKTETFEIKESLEFVTGKPSITELYVNGAIVNLNVNTTSGTASIACTIENGELDCR